MNWYQGFTLFCAFIIGLFFSQGEMPFEESIALESVRETASVPAPPPITPAEVDAYSQHPTVQRVIQVAMSSKRKSGGQCLEYVLRALQGSGLTSRWWAEGPRDYKMYAKYSAPQLEERGFVNLLSFQPKLTPELAPVGAILVYSGRNPGSTCKDFSARAALEKDCGHIEIRTLDGYVSDFFSSTPIVNLPGSTYVLTGVMVLNPSLIP